MIVANKKFVVKLSSEERKRLSELISKGKSAAKTVLKARILLKADQSEGGEGWTDERICEALDTNIAMVTRVRSRLVDDGLDAVAHMAVDCFVLAVRIAHQHFDYGSFGFGQRVAAHVDDQVEVIERELRQALWDGAAQRNGLLFHHHARRRQDVAGG